MGDEVRALTLPEALGSLCDADDCNAIPSFRAQTPVGFLDFCDTHVEEALDALPRERTPEQAPA